MSTPIIDLTIEQADQLRKTGSLVVRIPCEDPPVREYDEDGKHILVFHTGYTGGGAEACAHLDQDGNGYFLHGYKPGDTVRCREPDIDGMRLPDDAITFRPTVSKFRCERVVEDWFWVVTLEYKGQMILA
jgi:hypothetical protein